MKPALARAAGVILALALLAGCDDKKAEQKKEEAAVPVETAPVKVGAIDAAYRGTATLEAEDEATVNAKTGGVIQQVLAEEGQRVAAGQVLARMETERLKLEVARAKADADKAQEAHDRNTRIFEKNLISKDLYDQSRFALESAQAAYHLAKLTLDESEIRAPIAGVVSARFIKAGNTIAPGNQTFRVTRMDRLRASIYVPERDIHKLAAAQPATLQVDAWPDKVFKGAILRVNPVVDAQSGTVKVTVAMQPGQPELKPGMFGRVEVLYDRRDTAVLVPKDAVLTEDAAQAVFVVAQNKAHRRAIRTGYADAGYFEVLEGLKAGDQVVVTGQANLKDDGRVEVVNAGPSGSSSAPAAAMANK
ncbi:MAG TPA: efflux RND transporter periplasmic adaptor subunit [Candidatus Binatia bacterium]|nr:efflux RND transporter periplasmic adaptor subunit [Candidatus Binatia bacterium]